jgi:hypothetical protein
MRGIVGSHDEPVSIEAERAQRAHEADAKARSILV